MNAPFTEKNHRVYCQFICQAKQLLLRPRRLPLPLQENVGLGLPLAAPDF